MVISISIEVNSEVLYLGLWVFWSPLLQWHGPQPSIPYQLPFSRTDPSVISVTPVFYSPSPLPVFPCSLLPGSQYQQFLAPNKASTDPTLILLSFITLTSVPAILWSLDSDLSSYSLPHMNCLLPCPCLLSLHSPGKFLWSDQFQLLACPSPAMVLLSMVAEKHSCAGWSHLQFRTLNFKWILSAIWKSYSDSLEIQSHILLEECFISFPGSSSL